LASLQSWLQIIKVGFAWCNWGFDGAGAGANVGWCKWGRGALCSETGCAGREEKASAPFPLLGHFRCPQVRLDRREAQTGKCESQQLSVLGKTGLVDTRKDAKLVYYSLDAKRLAELGSLIGGLAGAEPVKQMVGRTPSAGVANFARLS